MQGIPFNVIYSPGWGARYDSSDKLALQKGIPTRLLLAERSRVGVKLIDLGNCFSVTGTDTSRISFEMQSLPFRAPEV